MPLGWMAHTRHDGAMTSPTRAPQQALILIDIQQGFTNLDFWGPTTNPEAEKNAAILAHYWQKSGSGPIVVVRHASADATSPLHPDNPGHALIPSIAAIDPDLSIIKNVNSAFYGTPDLHRWLQSRSVSEIVLAGIQTNMCVETTARMGGNLGYAVTVVLDATRTFDLSITLPDGETITRSAEELVRTTAVNLAGGGFARIAATADYLS